MSVTVAIGYVDGTIETALAPEWSSLRGEGVDWFQVGVGRYRASFQGHSLYWLYQEEDVWVAGCGSVRYSDQPLVEVLIHPDGTQEERPTGYFPDLPLSAVKLGHWRYDG